MRWLVIVAVAAACTTSSATQPDGQVAAAARCAPLEGKTFASLTQGECGLGPNGPSLCTWHLTFTANTSATTSYDWQHSDYGQSGEISCAGSDVTEVTGGSDQARGSYDAATQQLVWEDVTYAP